MAQEGMNLGVGFGKPVVESGCREMAKQPVLHAMNEALPTCPTALSPQEATDAIEDEVYAMHSTEQSDYLQKMSAVQTLVKGPRNFQIRHAVLRGHIPPRHIVRVDPKQLLQLAKEIENAPGVDDAKARLVAWRRGHPDMPPSVRTSAELQRLVMSPLSPMSPLPRMILRDLWLVLQGDFWYGKSWVVDWLKWGEPFDVEDPIACGRSIGGKSEPKRRALWTWYFGSAPYLVALQVPVHGGHGGALCDGPPPDMEEPPLGPLPGRPMEDLEELPPGPPPGQPPAHRDPPPGPPPGRPPEDDVISV